MTRDDLFEMLGLDDDAPAGESDPLAVRPAAAGREDDPGAAAAGPYAFAVDPWGARRGADLAAEDGEGLGLDAPAWADLHHAAFDRGPELLPVCADPVKQEFLAELLDTPDYRALHAATALDPHASAAAAREFARGLSRLRRDRAADRARKERVPKPPPPGRGRKPAAAAPEGLDTLRAVGAALEAAGKAVDEVKDAERALFPGGTGPGAAGGDYDPAAAARLFRRVRNSAHLRRIMDLAGRFRRVAQGQRRYRTTHDADEVTGVTLGGELARLVPGELARLVLPETEYDAFRRLAGHEAAVRDFRGKVPQGRGPVIVVVDESGSMQGDKVQTAKALGLALAWVARRDRRWCALVAFSGDTGRRVLPLPPYRWDEPAVLDWLEQFLSGGSYVDVPVDEMPGIYAALGAPRGKTDLLFVTDAQARLDGGMVDRFHRWKASVRARLTALVVGGAGAGDLARIADAVHEVAALTPEGAAAGAVLTL